MEWCLLNVSLVEEALLFFLFLSAPLPHFNKPKRESACVQEPSTVGSADPVSKHNTLMQCLCLTIKTVLGVFLILCDVYLLQRSWS